MLRIHSMYHSNVRFYSIINAGQVSPSSSPSTCTNRRLKHAGGDADDGAGLQRALCGNTAWQIPNCVQVPIKVDYRSLADCTSIKRRMNCCWWNVTVVLSSVGDISMHQHNLMYTHCRSAYIFECQDGGGN